MPPNVLLVVLDAARADSLEPYGAPPGSSPVVADLARRGAALTHAYAPASWTLPSHASMLSGKFPRALGLTQAPGGTPHGSRPVLEAHRRRLLPQVLRSAGYRTAAVSANPWVSRASGFATGFDDFVEVQTSRRAKMDSKRVRDRVAWALEGVRARADDGAAEAERALGRLLEDGDERPFLWLVNLVECHSPYLPPRPYNDLSPLRRLLAAEEARRHLTLSQIWRACAGGFDIPDAALERMRHLYRRSVLALDDWLGRLLTALDDRGHLDDTLVIVTSDHGENLGEDGLMAHAFSLDQRLIRVPFVVSDRAFADPDAVNSLSRLPRLVADYVGLAENPWSGDWLPEGVAVAQFDPPGPPCHPNWLLAFEEWGLDSRGVPSIAATLTCATDGRLKLLRRDEQELVFDLEADPREERPLGQGEVARLDGALRPLRDALSHPEVWVAPDAEPAPAVADDVSELEDRMRLLGYL